MHSSSCSAPPAAMADELYRQAGHLAALARRLEVTADLMPTADAGAAWWGPTREAVQVALDIERERLRREALRAHGAADQVRLHGESVSRLVATGLP